MSKGVAMRDIPSTPACAGLTDRERLCAGGRCLYPRVRGADEERYCETIAARPLPPRARG